MAKNEEKKYPVAELKISLLQFDGKNPRLPEKIRSEAQSSLLKFMAEEYDAITIARSIALHGYFPSEPLIVLEEGAQHIVVEGNRRLAALKLLQDETLRKEINLEEHDEWDKLAESAQIPDTVPVILVNDRRKVAPIVGYRHISGIEPWDPWAKARFVASLIHDEKLEFNEVADEVGESEAAIRANYRNYKIVEYARKVKIPTDRIEKSFGVFTRSMNDPKLREHIGVPGPSDVEKKKDIVAKDKNKELKELLTWLFGTEDKNRVIGESRDISKLGRVVGSENGLAVLRETGDLEEAFIAAGGIKDRLLTRLNQAIILLTRAEDDLPDYLNDGEVTSLLRSCKEAINSLLLLAGMEIEEYNEKA